jgi:hypothetical protein
MQTPQLLRTTLALGLSMLALTTAAWATNNSCYVDKYKIRYYASPADTYHHKRVIVYCDAHYKPISWEAEVFAPAHSDEQSKYFVALNEVHEYAKQGRYGCAARANTFDTNYAGFHGDPSWDDFSDDEFYWGLKVYATCVPKHCVDKYEGHGYYEWYDYQEFDAHDDHDTPEDFDQPEDPEEFPVQ